MAKQNVTVYINENNDYYVGEHQVAEDQLQTEILVELNKANSGSEGTVVVRSDKNVPVQYVVNVIDAVNNINNETHQKHKVLLATSAKK